MIRESHLRNMCRCHRSCVDVAEINTLRTKMRICLLSHSWREHSDSTPVVTRQQAEFCCKYCSKYGKGKGQKNGLYDLIDDMERKDALAKERYGEDFVQSTLGNKIHKAFMSEVGMEMCQAEVAHHVNKCPEYLAP